MAAAGSLLLILFVLFACGLWGSALLSAARVKRWRAHSLFFGPVTGMGLLVHAAALVGWTTGPSWTAAAGIAVTLTVLAAIQLRSDLRPRLGLFGPMTIAGVAGAWSLLAVLWKYSAFNPFHDAFTYLVHSQWLQSHAFSERVSATAAHPALSQIALYQAGHLRMGASFVLAWIQSLTGLDALHAYPAAITLPVACGGLALAGVVWSVVRGHRQWCLALGLLPGLTLNGATFAVSNGFLPQSYGLLFSLGALALASLGGRAAIPAAICFSAHVYCYPEALPFTLFGFLPLLAMRSARTCALAALGLGTLLAAPELFRAVPGLILQSGSVVGINSPISPVEALAHATGFFAGTFADRTLLAVGAGPALVVCLVVMALAAAGLRHASKWAGIAALGTVLVALALAWCVFRWIEINPWDGTRGNPWRQARAASWAVYPALTLIAAGLGLLWKHRRDTRVALTFLLACWLGTGALRHWTLADVRIAPLQTGLQCANDCFGQLSSLHHAATRVPANEPIGLAGFQGRGKAQQFLSLVLLDHPITADWRGDDYIAQYLPEREVTGDADHAPWLIAGRRPLAILPAARAAFLQSVEGGYPEGLDAQGWWHWTDSSLRFNYRLPPDCRAIRIRFQSQALQPRLVRVRLNSREIAQFKAGAPAAHAFDWPVEPAGAADIVFETEEPPAPAQSSDAQRLSFLIRNLVVDPAATP